MHIINIFLSCATATYYRTLRQYTLIPVGRIAKEDNVTRLQKDIHSWRAKKGHELNVVQVSVSLIISYQMLLLIRHRAE